MAQWNLSASKEKNQMRGWQMLKSPRWIKEVTQIKGLMECLILLRKPNTQKTKTKTALG